MQTKRRLPPGKVLRHFHAPTTVEDPNDPKTKAQIKEDGRVIISQDGEDDAFDEVNIPASFIFTIANMLNITKKTKMIDKEEIPK